MTLPQLRVLGKRWQTKLRLQDWEIDFRWMTKAEEIEWSHAEGFCKWNEQYKSGEVVVAKTSTQIKSTVIHELLHILWEGHLPVEDTLENAIPKEIAINVIAELLAK